MNQKVKEEIENGCRQELQELREYLTIKEDDSDLVKLFKEVRILNLDIKDFEELASSNNIEFDENANKEVFYAIYNSGILSYFQGLLTPELPNVSDLQAAMLIKEGRKQLAIVKKNFSELKEGYYQYLKEKQNR